MTFYTERTVNAVRKARACDGCGVKIEVGETALACSGHNGNNMWSGTFHHECREAEEALNKLHDPRWDDEWISLRHEMEWDDWPWLIDEFPAVAARMNITTERFNDIRDEQERCRKFFAASDAKRRAERAQT